MKTARPLLWIASSVAAAALALLPLVGCDRGEAESQASAMTDGGTPARGREVIRRRGCGSCHTIPGIHGADALVGPPLDRMGSRTYIAGVLQNTPQNLMRWLRDPPAVDPLTAMPNLRLDETEVKDVAAYLYTLK